MALSFPAFTTIDKMLVTATGFVVTVGGLILEYGGVIHLPGTWLAVVGGIVGIATTLGTYLAQGPEAAAKQIEARKADRAPAKRTTARKATPGAHPHKKDLKE